MTPTDDQVLLAMPAPAWETLQETLVRDSESNHFERELRQTIRAALDQVTDLSDSPRTLWQRGLELVPPAPTPPVGEPEIFFRLKMALGALEMLEPVRCPRCGRAPREVQAETSDCEMCQMIHAYLNGIVEEVTHVRGR